MGRPGGGRVDDLAPPMPSPGLNLAPAGAAGLGRRVGALRRACAASARRRGLLLAMPTALGALLALRGRDALAARADRGRLSALARRLGAGRRAAAVGLAAAARCAGARLPDAQLARCAALSDAQGGADRAVAPRGAAACSARDRRRLRPGRRPARAASRVPAGAPAKVWSGAGRSSGRAACAAAGRWCGGATSGLRTGRATTWSTCSSAPRAWRARWPRRRASCAMAPGWRAWSSRRPACARRSCTPAPTGGSLWLYRAPFTPAPAVAGARSFCRAVARGRCPTQCGCRGPARQGSSMRQTARSPACLAARASR